MSIGLFIDGSYMYKAYPGQVDYVKFRNEIEKHLGDSIDEAYFFNADDDPPNAKKRAGPVHLDRIFGRISGALRRSVIHGAAARSV